jgi:hypothetical protein
VLVELVDGAGGVLVEVDRAGDVFAPRWQRMAPSWRAPSTPMATSARRWRARVRSGAPGAIVRLR